MNASSGHLRTWLKMVRLFTGGAALTLLVSLTACGADDSATSGRQSIVTCHQGDPQCPPTTPPDGGAPDSGAPAPDSGRSDAPDEAGGDGPDLPYNYALAVGDSFTLNDAFAEKGPLPAAVLTVDAPAGTLHLADLRSGTPFIVKAEDCDHVGNKDVGRDRIDVTWRNADGSTETDHMTLRYCGH